ncbi:hypothetical protein ACETU7_05715 [Rhodococcus sp. 3Y1]
MRYSGKVWKPVHDDRVTKEVQRHFTDMFAEEAPTADGDRRKRLATLLAAHKIRAVKSLLRGLVKEDAEHFDSREHAHLLNCKNGVVDLRTGELLPTTRTYCSPRSPRATTSQGSATRIGTPHCMLCPTPRLRTGCKQS